MPVSYDSFFQAATGSTPYAYQRRLACGEPSQITDSASAMRGVPCTSRLISIPTGLGKTAAVVLAWLWNRVTHPDASHRDTWPRRLVYCLPMRTLVEQTRDETRNWVHKLVEADLIPAYRKPRVVVLMGGEALENEEKDWDIHPEGNTIIIGTQDMLLSRALNRGYGMSRYRWPIHFALLNNDCLWVLDETQLMGVGIETSAQLDGFRHDGKMLTVGACPSWWMSATVDAARLATVDHPTPANNGWPTLALSDAEKSGGRPKELITAPKKLSPTPLALNAATKNDYAKELAALIKERHQPGTLTLVVVNRVSRAREIYAALTTTGKKGKQTLPPAYDPERVALIHSRFRPVDRERHTQLLFGKGDRIVIATQAVEAGVDVSARLLITELAPWSSLVQRIGRCNRYADISDAEVLWVDIEPDAKGDLARPYTTDGLTRARTAIASLTDASPQTLRGVTVAEEKIIRPVIRRRDLVDLFDTTPDICGQDLDVSRYIRDGEDSDVQFFWRDSAEGKAPDEKQPQPSRDELCRVSIGNAREFFKEKTTRAWQWNPLEKKWEPTGKPRPGGVYLIATTSGGYSDALGWSGEPKDMPTPHPPASGDNEAHDAEPDSFSRAWQKLDKHTQLVVTATDALADALALDASAKATLHTAALWHDVGKAHEEFQKMLRNGEAPPGESELWAKSKNMDGKCARRGFRHELASALAWLLAGPRDTPERDLVAYLIAAHHGKVRLSIRSLPNEPTPEPPTLADGTERLFARGIWQGDKLPPVALGETTTPAVTLDLSFMKMGDGPQGPSWLARTVTLRDRLGPFRLAFLESLLRAADARASRNANT